MNRHERNLLRIGAVLIVGMAALRISHCISSSVAQSLLLFGCLFGAAALTGYHKRLKAENNALRARQEEDDSARR